MQRTEPGLVPPPSRDYHPCVAGHPAALSNGESLRAAGNLFLAPNGIGIALLREGTGPVAGPDREPRRSFRPTSLDDRLFCAIPDARRARMDLALLMIGVDRLDEVNAEFGRLAGDGVLATIAGCVLEALRVGDLLARYGGDEFALLATGLCSVEARLLAEHLRRSVKALQLSARGREVRVTVSVGLTTLAELGAEDRPARLLLARAYSRMCGARAMGRSGLMDVDSPPLRGATWHEVTAA
jgi:diguanylate cyclase (GGDEF)-like protein